MTTVGIVQRMSLSNNCEKHNQRAFRPKCFSLQKKLKPHHLLVLLVLFSCRSHSTPSLRIAAAANMQYAIKALSLAFEKKTGIPCSYALASSGKLTAQITEGAPFDLFLSADLKYPQALYKAGLTNGPPKIYAYGELILWTKQPHIRPKLDELFREKVRHIALANPKTAPYGKAAREVLEKIDTANRLAPKLIYGESISQVNHFILSGNAQLGFTAKSIIYAPEIKQQTKWTALDDSLYTPIAQGVVVLKGSSKPSKEALLFRDFLFSTEAQKILHNFGYRPQ